MAKNARVPQFGKWENDGSVPYTQYFENARKGKNSTKLINPNDPLQNPEAFHQGDPPVHAYSSEAPSNQGSVRVKHERRKSREDVNGYSSEAPSNQGSVRVKHEQQKSREDVNGHQAVTNMSTETLSTHKRSSGSPTETLSTHKRASGSPNPRHDHGNLGDPQRKPSHSKCEFEHNIEPSPLHPHLNVKSSWKGVVSSPSRERRASSEKHGLAPNTPGRTKMKPNDRNDNALDKGSAVPKFGEWDVMDPASADSYSYIFNQVREEKHSGSTKIPSFSRDSNSNGQRKKINSESTDVCCSCFK